MRLAKILGAEQSILADVLNASTPLSPELALRVEKAFGVGMDMLRRMQAFGMTALADFVLGSDEIKVERLTLHSCS